MLSSLKRGLVSGAALPASLRQELAARGVEVLQCYATAELGVIAYESEAREGMIVNETLLVEIVRPGTGDPVADRRGRRGRRHLVQSGLSDDPARHRRSLGGHAGSSPCGRTNMRIKGWMGRADQTTKVKGMFVHPAQVAEVGKRHPELGRLRLAVTRAGEQDVDDAARRMRGAGRWPAGGGRRHPAVRDQAPGRGRARGAGKPAE